MSRASRVFSGLRLLRAKRAAEIITYARLVRAECCAHGGRSILPATFCALKAVARYEPATKRPRGARRVRAVRKRQGLGEPQAQARGEREAI